MLTPFGRFLRKLRIDLFCGMKDMAGTLNVTMSYLSAVEMGRRNIPKHWEEIIGDSYNLTPEQRNELKKSIQNSVSSISINLKEKKDNQRSLALEFARKLDMLDDNKIGDIRKMLSDKDEKEL